MWSKLVKIVTVGSLLLVPGLVLAVVTANPDTLSGTEDNDVTGNVLANDVADGGGGMILVSVSDPAEGGSTAFNGAGDVTYTPPANLSGTFNFTYIVRENVLACMLAAYPGPCFDDGVGVYEVAPIADAPTPSASNVAGAEDTTIALSISAALIDTDGSQTDTVVISGVPGGASIGGASDQGAGIWTAPVAAAPGLDFTPPANANGLVSLSVMIRSVDSAAGFTDHQADSGATVFNVNVTPVNDAPVAGTPPAITTTEDVNGSADLSTTFTDVDIATNGDSLTLSVDSFSGAVIQSATMTGTTLNVVVAPNLNGVGSVVVRATDGGGMSETVNVSVTVDPANDAPTAGPAPTLTTDEDVNASVSLAGVFNDADIATNGDSLTFAVTGFAHTAIQSASMAGTDLNVVLLADQSGTGSVTVEATDTGGLTASANVSVNVSPVNDAPVAGAAPTLTTDEDVDASISLAGAFSDPDIATSGDTLTYTVDSFSHPAIQSASMAGDSLGVVLNANLNGSGTVTVRATDAGGLSDTVAVNVVVNAIDDDPRVVNPLGNLMVNEDDSPTVIDVSTVFDDDDIATNGDSLSITAAEQTVSGVIAGLTVSGGNLTISYVADQNGVTVIELTATDISGGTAVTAFQLDVDQVNDQPYVDVAPGAIVTDEDVNASVDLAGVFNDVDIATNGDSLGLSVDSWSNPAINVASIGGTVLSVTLLQHEFGTGNVVVRATDVDGLSITANVSVTVNAQNDDPAVVFYPGATNVAEDDPDFVIDMAGVFTDPDLATGDSLTLSVVTDAGYFDTLFDGFSMTGTDLNVSLALNQHGTGKLRVIATDSAGASEDLYVDVVATPVNDQPTLTGSIADVLMPEDGTRNHDVDVFDDVDSVTDGDTLSYTVSANTNPTLFPSFSFAGATIDLVPAANLSGTADITVRATDTGGLWVEDTFTVTVTGVNDMPIANPDSYVIDEDTPQLTINALANDYLHDAPVVLSSVNHIGTHTVLDAFDDEQVMSNATVSISGSDIIYQPTENYFGVDTFEYTIRDADGETSTGTITVTVNAVNDPPEGLVERNYTMQENGTLSVNALNGVLVGAYDLDDARLDENGDPMGDSVTVQLQTLPTDGNLNFDPSNGSFDYTPPLNFTGDVFFTYRLFDNEALSVNEYQANISVNAVTVVVVTPTPGEVSVTYDLAQTPLEQSGTVPPNVLVLMDDSGSMDWNFVIAGPNDQGRFLLDNDPIANDNVRETTYSYLWDLDNSYDFDSSNGYIAPTEEALDADNDTDNNGYGVWRARNHKFNRLYYNPQVRYVPWIGQDENGDEFADAVPNAIRLNPVDADNTWNMLAPHSYTAYRVPRWRSGGGRESIDVTNMYVPYYYYTAEDAPLEEDDARTKVEIRTGSTYTGGASRTDCLPGDNNPLVCTYDQEIQNFANFMQYYRSREHVTKAAMGSVLEDISDLRIGLRSISGRTRIDIEDMNDRYTEGNKKALLDRLYSFYPSGGTPLRDLLDIGGRILGCNTGGDCPALPHPEGQCQQNFALMFSDGYWNGAAGIEANTDQNSGTSDFDGGRYADTYSDTLADTAMYYYENDLFPAVDDEVPVGSRDRNGAPSAVFDGVENMHQHVKTYGIAFGLEGTVDIPTAQAWDVSTAFAWPNPYSNSQHKLDDVLHASINGRGDFLSAGDPQELLASMNSAFLEFSQAASSASAAAFNSTSLRDGTLLYRGFYDLRDRTGELTATQVSNDGVIAASPDWRASEQLNPANKLPANRVLVTYNPATNQPVGFTFGNLAPQQQFTLDADQVQYIRGDRSDEQPSGDLRRRLATGGLLGPIVNSSPVFVGKPRGINRDQAPYPTDDLYSEFVDDKSSRTEMVYVGANDGILHGFDAQSGEELFGYIPNTILDASKRFTNKLNDFTSPFYYHNYYVDLSPRLNDVYMRPSATAGSKEWITALVGGLGGGGKGYFALNVTDPATTYANETAAKKAYLWEFTEEDDTYPLDLDGDPIGGADGAITDPDGNPVKDLGYATAVPLVQMTNATDSGSPARQEWGVIFGNGANSTAGIATLFVLFKDRGLDGWGPGDFVKLTTGYGVALPGEQQAGYPNALGTPTAVDADLNGTVDYVYAGDRLGNLFRFDLTSNDPDDWHAVHLFQATYDDGSDDIIQPIQAQPLVVKNPAGEGFIVIFGTGSYLAKDDANNTEIQSIYGIWDRLDNFPVTSATNTKADRLVEQEITNVVDDSGAVAITRRIVSRNGVGLIADGTDPGVYGWYIDLDMERAADTISGAVNPDSSGLAPPNPQYPGERAIRRIVFRNGAIITTTILPATDEFSCSGVRPGSVLVMDAYSGGDLVDPIIDFNQDGYVDDADLISVDGEAYSGGLLFNQEDLDGALVDLSTLGGEGDLDFLFVSGGNDTKSYRIASINEGRTGRLSWIELQQ